LDFDYNDEQKALKEEARRFLTNVAPLSAVRAVYDVPEPGHDAALWQRVAREQGWCGTAIPEKYGGLGLGYVELCALAEELGRALTPVPFGPTVYQFAESLLLAGSEAQKQAVLPQVAAGELVGTLAVTEGPGVPSAAGISTRFADGRLTGTKLPVADGMAADRAVVLAQDGAGLSLFLVDLRSEGVTVDPLSVLDPSRGGARVMFADAPAERLGAAGEGLALLARIDDRAAVLYAFEQLGGADRCLEMARDYALERYAFGRPIGSYQAIKHKLADVFVKNSIARANAYYGAWALSADAPELPVAAAAAHIAGAAAYWLASKENIQTHGGIGVTWEADCQLFYRRSRHLALIMGSPRLWKRRLIDRIETREASRAEQISKGAAA
jgi:alkylation response protein AidB-like acyl-CoA dehydrogenase